MRKPTNQIAGQVSAMRNAQAPMLEPPSFIELRPEDLPFFYDIVNARPRESWNNSDLLAACTLARCRCDMESVHASIVADGYTLTNGKGTVVCNPLVFVFDVLAKRALAYARALHVHAEATCGESKLHGDQAATERAAATLVAQLHDGDGLIPTMHSTQ